MQKSFIAKLTAAQLRRAADLRDKIENMERELTRVLGIPEQFTVGHVLRKKRRLSAAGRKRIADATRARWARLREAKKR